MQNFYPKHLKELGMTELDPNGRGVRLLAVMRYLNPEIQRVYKKIVVIFKEGSEMKAGVVSTTANGDFISFDGWVHTSLAIDNPSLDKMRNFIRLNFFCDRK